MFDLFSEIISSNFYFFILSSVLILAIFLVHQKFSQQLDSVQCQLDKAQNEIRAINSGNIGMGRKISRFAADIANVEITNNQQEFPNVNEKIYRQAGLLLARGATIEEVVDSCEITPAEAELLSIMQHSSHKKVING